MHMLTYMLGQHQGHLLFHYTKGKVGNYDFVLLVKVAIEDKAL